MRGWNKSWFLRIWFSKSKFWRVGFLFIYCGGGTVYIWGSVLFCLDVLVRTFYSVVATYEYLAQILFYSWGWDRKRHGCFVLLDILTCAKALNFCDLLIPLTPTFPLPLLPKKITKLSCMKDNRKSGLPKSLHFLSVAGMHPIFIPKLWEYPFLYSQTFILLFFIYKFISGFVFVISFVDESRTFS